MVARLWRTTLVTVVVEVGLECIAGSRCCRTVVSVLLGRHYKRPWPVSLCNFSALVILRWRHQFDIQRRAGLPFKGRGFYSFEVLACLRAWLQS